MKAKEAMKLADEKWIVEIGNGIFLESRDALIANQVDWTEVDGSKDSDFSGYPYWITSDNGIDPIPVSGYNDRDLLDILSL